LIFVLSFYLRVYGILALSHIGMQIVLGHLHQMRSRPRTALANLPSVAVIVPVYNEDPQLLENCLASLERQEHPAMQVIVVDDGSPNITELEPVYRKYCELGWTILRLSSNVGKRAAQRVGFDAASTDVVVTIDSDTVMADAESVATLTRSFLRRRVSAVTGAVGVANGGTNLLTRLTALRYWMAFHQERAAQSLFGVMLCCSGPFSAYRRSVIDEVKDDYVSQSFLGQRCTFGDDRHLTNLVLSRGYRAIFDPDAKAITHVPDTLDAFLRQQVRWNRSFYREILWSLRFVHRRNPYLAIELAFQTFLPFMLLGAIVSVGVRAVSDPMVAAKYVGIVAVIALLRCSYGVVRTRNLRFLLFAVYGFVHVLLLLPARMFALSTMGRTHWGTRGASRHVVREHGGHERAEVMQAMPRPREPRPQEQRQSTVMAVDDTRAARTVVDPVEPTAPVALGRQDILPALSRDALGRWRPSKSTVVVVPRQQTASPPAQTVTWARWRRPAEAEAASPA